MLRFFQQALLTTVLLALSYSPVAAVGEELCSTVPKSYPNAKLEYPATAFAIQELEKYSITKWYTDRAVDGPRVPLVQSLVDTCSESSRMTLVVYGLPNKDCEAGYSSDGDVKTADDYVNFITDLTTIVGDRKILYVLEPDAVGLLAKAECAKESGYLENVQKAIELLSANPNAEIYLDVGYWTLADPSTCSGIADVVKQLAGTGKVKGITLNTSNYRSTDEIANLCTKFQQAYGSDALHCIVDTSRNLNGSPSSEWCNNKNGAIGIPPTCNTGYANLDYFMWIKPPGESDGKCDDGSHTADALKGPAAGVFFEQGFKQLWDQGYFVKQQGMPVIGDYISSSTGSNSTTEQDNAYSPGTVETEGTLPASTSATPETTAPVVTSSAAPATSPPTVAPTSATPSAGCKRKLRSKDRRH